MGQIHQFLADELLAKERIQKNQYGEYEITDQGRDDVLLILNKLTPEQTMLVGFYYAYKLGVTIDY